MIKLQTYAGLSLVITLAVFYHAFSSRGQFYPAMVYLSTAKIGLALFSNMGLVVMCTMWQVTKKIFLGKLRESEVERLNEQSWREIMEIMFTITIFRQDFSVMFLAFVTALLLIKSLHWLAQKRVEYIETTPSVPVLSHIRIVSFMGFLLLMDSIFLYNGIKHLMETRRASASLFFSFEYMILALTTVSTIVKYIFYVSDMLMEGRWEKKAVYTFYLELIRDLLHLTMCLFFSLAIFVNYGLPLHLIRDVYETLRNLKVRLADYIRYRNITSNMNDRFPDATPEELTAIDAICIICREDMTTAKKLICGHLFHEHCLRSWLERQSTCPTCRAPAVPPENGISATMQGTSTAGTSSIGGLANGDVSQHQTRLQAAASAASLYEKSFVYPPPNSVAWSPGYALLPHTFGHPTNTVMASVGGEGGTASGLSQQCQSANTTFMHLPQHFSSEFLGISGHFGEGSASDSQLNIQRTLIKHQIEFLQSQLQLLQTSNGENTTDVGTSDTMGNYTSSPSSSVINSSETVAVPSQSTTPAAEGSTTQETRPIRRTMPEHSEDYEMV